MGKKFFQSVPLVSYMHDWMERLDFFRSRKYQEIQTFLEEERGKGKSILPSPEDIFNTLKLTPFDRVKVVIIGQDPYPNKRHAHGLAFSIPKNCPDIPKSLANIFTELKDDLGSSASHGNLNSWALQGVLLLNTTLTVEEGNSNSHQSIGWMLLTQELIKHLNARKSHLAFILWGNHAQKFKKFIDPARHLIIESAHPSPLSAYRGFFGSKCFSRTNTYLAEHGISPIDWKV